MPSSLVLGKNLRRWREGKKFPLKRVAMELGVSVSALNHWEQGRRFPAGVSVDALARYWEIPLPCLFCGRLNASVADCMDCPARSKPAGMP